MVHHTEEARDLMAGFVRRVSHATLAPVKKKHDPGMYN
jgi:hypothetical protein